MARGILLSLIFLQLFLLGGLILTIYIRFKYSRSKDTPKSLIPKVVEKMGLKKGERVVDLGAGDFRVVYQAATVGANGSGVEISPMHILLARLKKLLRFRKYRSVKIIPLDLFSFELDQYDVIYLNHDTEMLHRIGERLASLNLEKKRVYSFYYPIESFGKSEEIEVVDGITLHCYTF